MICRSEGLQGAFDVIALRDHSCLVFDTWQEQVSIFQEFTRVGLQRRERCLFLLSEQDFLTFTSWTEPEFASAIAGGMLLRAESPSVTSPDYPGLLRTFLEGESYKAEADGFSGLRLINDIVSLLGEKPSVSDYLALHSTIEGFVLRFHALSLCCFDRRRLPPSIVREILYHHPSLIQQQRMVLNPFYAVRTVGDRGDPSAREVEGMFRCFAEFQRLETFFSDTEGRYRNLVNSSREAIFVEVAGRIVWSNPAGFALFGAGSPAELLQRHFSTLVDPGQRDLLGYFTDEDGRSEFSEEGRREELLVRLDGHRFLAEVKRLRLPGRDGRAVLMQIRDITEGKRAELALRRSAAETEEIRDLVEGILQSVADGVIVTDLCHRILLMNTAAEKMLRVSLSQVRQEPLAAAIPNEHLREQFRIFSWQWGAEMQQVEFPLPAYRKEGSRTIQARFSVLRGKKGKRLGVITVLQDITLQRQFEQMKNELISTMAHELRTPLTAVMGFSELLLRQPDAFDPQQKEEILGEINAKAQVLKKLIDELADLNRFESGQALPLVKSRCSLLDLVRTKTGEFQLSNPACRLDVEFVPGDPGNFWLDHDKIGQVLENLISNAIKYSHEGSRILVKGEVIGKYYVISVQDEGIGMSAEQKARIFDKFYRVDSSNTATGGIGLGMSLARYIVHAHGGRIWVRSRPGEGTTVSFSLPRQNP